MIEYLFIRHGQTDWNIKQKVMGRQPIPLNETGRKQAREVAKLLKNAPMSAIATSPVERALETAQVIVDEHPELQLMVEEGLTEIDYGDLVNMKVDEVIERYAHEIINYQNNPEEATIPGGESLREAQKRVSKTVADLRQKHPEGRIVIVSHADVIKLAVIDLLGLSLNFLKSLAVDNGAMILVKVDSLFGARLAFHNQLTINGMGKDI